MKEAAEKAAQFVAESKPSNVSASYFLLQVEMLYRQRFGEGQLEREGKRERSKARRADPNAAIKAALARGAKARRELEDAEGGSHSSEELAGLFGVTRQAVDQQRKSRKLVAWMNKDGNWRFPVWQISKVGKPYDRLGEILSALPGDPWSDMLFFLRENRYLPAGERPLDLLRRGDVETVRLAALRYGRHGG
jgi:hypothetical protein